MSEATRLTGQHIERQIEQQHRAQLTRRLEAMNERFYQRYAAQFDGTRMSGWEGWRALIDELPRDEPLSVLDLGCGNGRLARVLRAAQAAEPRLLIERYRGLDRCEALLRAAAEHERGRQREAHQGFPCEWLSWSWGPALEGRAEAQAEREGPLAGAWSWVTLFGVTHHVFSFERRLQLLTLAAERLAPGGTLSVSHWDFGASARWEGKRLSWEPLRVEWGAALDALEEGDSLLGWGGSAETPRYCHWVSPAEERALSERLCELRPELELSPLPTRRDPKGHNRYQSWRRAPQ